MLRNVLLFLSLVTMLCTVMSRYMDFAWFKPRMAPAVAASAEPAPPPAQVSNGYRSVTLRADNHGHFNVEAMVDGRRLEFMVDTGASMIAIRETSAAKLGIFPSVSDYKVKTQTANGAGKAAPVRLNRVEINGITVRDVQAFVVPDEQLSVNLLGNSFLQHVKYSQERGRLIIEQ